MIDRTSPAGSWRAALSPDLTCAVCKQPVCDHTDGEWSGGAIHPQLCEAEAMQYESPDPFHDRQLRKRRAAEAADRLLVAAAILGVLALVAAVSGPAWHHLLDRAVLWPETSAAAGLERPVAP